MINVMIIIRNLRRDTAVSKRIGLCTSHTDQISYWILEQEYKEHATNIRIILQRDLSATEDTLNNMRLLLRRAFLLMHITKMNRKFWPNLKLQRNLNKRLMVCLKIWSREKWVCLSRKLNREVKMMK